MPHSSPRWFVSPDRNWRTRLCCPALISTPSQSASTAPRAAAPKPATTAAMSSASIHFGTSREATSGTRDGAHSGRWLYADEPCPPAWSSEAMTSAPCGRQAATIDAHPAVATDASGARSYGQSDSWTLAPSTTIVPQPPRARRS